MVGYWETMGMFTCHTPNGSSVVDYMIINEDDMDMVVYFEILDLLGHISDHSCILSALRIHTETHKYIVNN